MTKDSKTMPDCNDDIPLFRVGDMRWMNVTLPEHFANADDGEVVVLPRSMAERLFTRILSRWGVPEPEAEAFRAEADTTRITRVLQIHQYLRVLFRESESAEWVQTCQSAFDDQTPWSLICDGRIEQVFNYLDVQVFAGGPRSIRPLTTRTTVQPSKPHDD